VVQHNGTAIQSLASEHLQELENVVDLKSQKQEDIIKATLGSLYMGEALHSSVGYILTVNGTYEISLTLSGGSDTVRASQ
jgi:hypothetical protein